MKQRPIVLPVVAACVFAAGAAMAEDNTGKDAALVARETEAAVVPWPSEPPEGCPFKPSDDFGGIALTGRFANYTDGDTFFLSWGADGRLYTPFADTDGNQNPPKGSIGVNGIHVYCGNGKGARVGYAVIEGGDPLALKFVDAGTIASPGAQYNQRYPCACLHYNGVWYLGTGGAINHSLGPFVGFHISKDNGRTWTPSPLSADVGKGLFPEPATFKGPVKLGYPHVVDFGKNNGHSRDGKMYLVGHGSATRNCGWITGDQVYLCRVTPSPETVNDESHYEYFAGHDGDGKAIWSEDFADIRPIADWHNEMGQVSMTYNAPLKKYLMCVTDGWPVGTGPMNTFLLESDRITGPWKMLHYFKHFGPQAYSVSLPSRFISADGRRAWLCLAANWSSGGRRLNPETGKPRGCMYAMSLHEITLNPPNAPGGKSD